MVKKVIKTVAREANDELVSESNNSALFQTPFSTRKYTLTSARLSTTLVELDILRGTQAIGRLGYEQDDVNKTIVIPTIFAKVDGLPVKESSYWDRLNSIRDSKGLEALVSMHFRGSDWFIDDESFAILKTKLTADTLRSVPAWSYDILNIDLQRSIADAIVSMIEDWPFSFERHDDTLSAVLSMALEMPKELLDMTSEVDYPLEVPLLAFIHQESFGSVTQDDAVAMTLFHYLGWDVIVYAPNGYASLESYLNADEFDQFNYEKMQSTIDSKGNKKSFLKTLFGE